MKKASYYISKKLSAATETALKFSDPNEIFDVFFNKILKHSLFRMEYSGRGKRFGEGDIADVKFNATLDFATRFTHTFNKEALPKDQREDFAKLLLIKIMEAARDRLLSGKSSHDPDYDYIVKQLVEYGGLVPENKTAVELDLPENVEKVFDLSIDKEERKASLFSGGVKYDPKLNIIRGTQDGEYSVVLSGIAIHKRACHSPRSFFDTYLRERYYTGKAAVVLLGNRTVDQFLEDKPRLKSIAQNAFMLGSFDENDVKYSVTVGEVVARTSGNIERIHEFSDFADNIYAYLGNYRHPHRQPAF